jgi:hypothetical protein
MDAWAVVMSDQAIKQATHARTIELSSGTLDPVTVVTVLSSTITSASPGHRIGLERLLQEYRSGGMAVVLYGNLVMAMEGTRDRVETRLSIPRVHAVMGLAS